ncbi:MAG: hypothetical protein S0880_20885 [Actinomycetota bacterium]|nr:hypothetical protein [Actinomycetota bacterium]
MNDPAGPSARAGHGVAAVAAVLLAGAVSAGVACRRSQARPGATWHERRGPLPGDEPPGSGRAVVTCAATVAGPPELVWPWLLLAVRHRADRHARRRAGLAPAPTAEPPALAVGDRLPPRQSSGRAFRVTDLEPGRHVVLRSVGTHPGARIPHRLARTWSFVVRDTGEGDSRVLVRTATALGGRWRWPVLWPLVARPEAAESRRTLDHVEEGVARDRAEIARGGFRLIRGGA